MIERIFVGWDRPTLSAVVGLLQGRYRQGGVWDMGDVLVALPGRQAGRRLRRLINDAAAEAGVRHVTPPETLTPSELMERLYQPPLPIAGPMAAHFAWAQAARVEENAVSAAEARRVREAATAECLALADVARCCRDLPGIGDGRCWEALARLEAAYLSALAAVGLADRDQARSEALATGGVTCDHAIYCVGAQDLNGLERALLRALPSRVTVVIPAPEEDAAHFDDTGTLDVDYWHGADVPIPDAFLQFVDGPAEEAEALIAHVAALGGAFAREEITVGVGDESAADGLARRLAVLGLPVLSPLGRSLSRVRPGALLGGVHDFLCSPTIRAFAALVRHPDLESWLTRQSDPAEDATPLPTSLDIYQSECLPQELPAVEDVPVARARPCPARAKNAWEAVLDAHVRVDGLLAPLRGQPRPLADWAGPILGLLQAVYAQTSLTGATADDRQLARSLDSLASLLRALRGVPAALAPALSGAEALALVLDRAEDVRLPPDAHEVGSEMRGWLELALDDAPVLLLTGLHEGCVPAVPGDDSLLPDDLRRRLGLADDRRRRARDGLLLRQMLESRRTQGRCVRLIVARRGTDGDPRMPSRLLFAADGETAARRALLFASRPADAPSARPLFTPGTARALGPPPPEPLAEPPTGLGVSAFRDYLACPYRFYLRHVLKLTGLDDQAEEMDAPRFGSLVHDCLSAFARSDEAQAVDAAKINAFLRHELHRQAERRYGPTPPPAVRTQVHQAGRRLAVFAAWQAQSVREGWYVQPDLCGKGLTAGLEVDGEPFPISGSPDRVDCHLETGRYRIWDYKTGGAGRGPEEKHRRRADGTGGRVWTDLQLPLYRLLLAQNGAATAPDAGGYVLLAADLGTKPGAVAPWTEEDQEEALECARGVVRAIRAGLFWPPADPPPLPPARRGRRLLDAYSGLCLDSCDDRRDWFMVSGEGP